MTVPKTVAITGGGNGIGRAIASRYVQAGVRVMIGDIDADAAARTAAELGERAGAVPVDVRDESSFDAFLDAAEAANGPLDLLVNNAGVDWVGAFDAEPADVSRRQIEVNLIGAINGTRLALWRMLPRRQGHIVNVASAVGRVPQPFSAVYSATKWGIVGLTESLRLEYRSSGVRFSLVLPGMTDTAMIDGTGRPSPRVVPLLSPDDCAREVLSGVEQNRFEIWSPRTGWIAPKLGQLVPRAVRDRGMIAVGLADIAGDADSASRRAYHDRAFGSPR